jgi:endonuclease G
MKMIKMILLLLLSAFVLCTHADQEFGVPFHADLHLQKQGFSLGYSHKYRQAVWVAYTLTAENLQMKQVRRRDKFKADPAVKKRPVRPRDYARSGYDKGHLAPAADMTYSFKSMTNSFLMTSILPQVPGCNRGIWKRLETQVRRWAVKEEKIYVITGPVFSGRLYRMKKSRIPIPVAFYKIIFDLTPPMKMIGFVIPNQTSKRRVVSFAVPVDEVERITGYDFFNGLDDELEEKLERSCDFQLWER